LSHLENQLEVFRGQIEELQGKMQQAMSQLEGLRGMTGYFSGRGHEMRGRARQTVARARIGVEDFRESVVPEVFRMRRESGPSYAPYWGLFLTGAVIVALALIWPQAYSRIWGWFQRPVERAMGETEETSFTNMTT
jgi:hypothetical protein